MLCPLEREIWQFTPLHAPLKPEKLDPEVGVAVRVTEVPLLKLALQAVGQLIPAGLLVTVPEPETVTVNCAESALANVAETDWLLESASWHDFPLHAPLYPENLKPEPAVALRVMEVPDGKLAVQVVGQLIPAGLLVMDPVPVTATVS